MPSDQIKEGNFPVDLTFPPKPTNLNRMEKKITISKGPKEIPRGPRHQLRRGGVMGHTGYHRPSEKDNWKKDMDMESSTAVATDVAELQNKLVQWKKPNGITLQFVVWEVGSDTVELREVVDMPHKRTKRDKVEIPRQVLQTALEAGNIEIVGTSPYGGIDEHLEVLTKIISKLFD